MNNLPARSTPATAPVSSRVKKPRCPFKPPLMMRDHMAKAREIATQFPRLRARLGTAAAYSAEPEGSFEFGLQAILDGLEAQLHTRRTPAPGMPGA